MATTTVTFSEISQHQTTSCVRCGKSIYWQTSRKPPYKRYPTDVIDQNGKKLTARNNFHSCKQSDIDALNHRKAEQAGQQTFTQPKLNMVGVNQLFDRAAANLKFPKIRLQTKSGEEVALYRAGKQSRYPGNVMVTNGRGFSYGKYFGRVDLQGNYVAGRDHSDEVFDLLSRLGTNPAEVASQYGQLTGNCCFCYRRLDDPRSVSVGYGPVCAGHYGLPWGTVPAPVPQQPQTVAQTVSQPVPVSPVPVVKSSPWKELETNGRKHYEVEASELGGNPTCPNCGGQFANLLQPWKKDGDLLWWNGQCVCGTELTIFND